MSLFDLLFLFLALSTFGTLVWSAVTVIRGRGRKAVALLRGLGVVLAIYMATVVVVALATPQRYRTVGEEQCSDDWCIAVASIDRRMVGERAIYDVAFRLSSRAKRVVQRERGVAVFLSDGQGRRYDPMPDASAGPFDAQLGPGDAVKVVRVFELPTDAQSVGVVITRSGIPFPGCCIIGDENSPFHKKTIIRPQ